MVLAIAIVVDDAIVVVEGVHAKLDQGYKSSRKASIDAMSELGGAIVSITLVMMSVFIPVSFMGGTSGTFYRQFGLTMAIAIGFSAINALTLSPALCALFLKPHQKEGEKKMSLIDRFHTSFNTAYDIVLKKYKRQTSFFINHKWLSIGTVVLSVIVLVFLMRSTPTGLVPNEDTGTIFAMVSMPPGTSMERTDAMMQKVDSMIAAIPAVKGRTQITGYNFVAGQGNSYGSIIVKLKDWKERSSEESSDNIIKMLYGKSAQIFNEGQILFFAPPMIPGYGVSSGFELKLTG